MKCYLHNTCARNDWCCNFCTLKCDVRCNNDHDSCKWFADGAVEELADNGKTVRFFKYKIDDKGNVICDKNGLPRRYYYSLAELNAELEELRAKRGKACQKSAGKQ